MSSTNYIFKSQNIHSKAKLYLCPLRFDEEALKEYTSWMNNSKVIKYIGGNDRPTTIEKEKEWLNEQTKSSYETTFNIVLHIDNEEELLIGTCSITIHKFNLQYATIGIIIGNDNYRNQKLGTIALQMLLDFAFNDNNLHTVALTVSEDNKQAINCYIKVGFKKQGMHRNTFYYEGKFHNAVYMDITKEEWLDLYKK